MNDLFRDGFAPTGRASNGHEAVVVRRLTFYAHTRGHENRVADGALSP